jgi:CheY-like chemotaxis protein
MADSAKAVMVLIADRDVPVRSLLEEYLRRLGYEVFSVGNGREAVDIGPAPHYLDRVLNLAPADESLSC